jgi:hypothetical protein
MTPYDSVKRNASYTDCSALPSGVKLGKMLGSTGHLFTSRKVLIFKNLFPVE